MATKKVTRIEAALKSLTASAKNALKIRRFEQALENSKLNSETELLEADSAFTAALDAYAADKADVKTTIVALSEAIQAEEDAKASIEMVDKILARVHQEVEVEVEK